MLNTSNINRYFIEEVKLRSGFCHDSVIMNVVYGALAHGLDQMTLWQLDQVMQQVSSLTSKSQWGYNGNPDAYINDPAGEILVRREGDRIVVMLGMTGYHHEDWDSVEAWLDAEGAVVYEYAIVD